MHCMLIVYAMLLFLKSRLLETAIQVYRNGSKCSAGNVHCPTLLAGMAMCLMMLDAFDSNGSGEWFARWEQGIVGFQRAKLPKPAPGQPLQQQFSFSCRGWDFVVPVVARKSDFCAVTTLVQLRQQLRANLDPYTALASFPRFVQVAGMSQAEATAVLCISRLPGIGKTLSNWPKTTTFLLSCATHFAGVRACRSPRLCFCM